MILLIARLPGSPVTFMVPELTQILTEYFPGIEMKTFDPDYILSTLDGSYNELKNKVEILRDSHTSFDSRVREELLKIFTTVLLAPYDLLIVEGMVRSEDDVKRWKEFFSDKKELLFILEKPEQDLGPPEFHTDEYKEFRSSCIISGSTHYGDDIDEVCRFFKKRLSPTLEHLAPA